MYHPQRVHRRLALAAAGLAALAGLPLGAPVVRAAEDVQITVVAYVDVAPATDPACPGCDGEFTAEDQDFAQTHALPPMTFVVRDGDGAELGQSETTELTVGIQRTLFTLPAAAVFVVELAAVPDGWQLCGRDELSRRLTPADFNFGTARAEYHFTQGCALAGAADSQSGGTPTAGPTATNDVPTAPAATATALKRPAAAGQTAATPTGTIKGFACRDDNGDGQVDPVDPGLAGIQVRLAGPRGTLITRTPSDGSFSFDYLAPGRYEVMASPYPSWRMTTPERYTVTLAAGQVALGNDFCMVPADGPAAAVRPGAGRGVRLPDTGLAALTAAPLLSTAALMLAALGALGFAAERCRHGRA